MDQSPYRMLSTFIRALSHKIRTPLSVIQNDLTHLSTLLPPDECKASLEKCSEISNILGRLSDLLSGEILMSRINLHDQIPSSQKNSNDGPAWIYGSSSMLQFAIAEGCRLLEIPSLSLVNREDTLVIEGNSTLPKRVVVPTSCSFLSFTELFNAILAQDSLEAPIIDSIFNAHRATISLEVTTDGGVALSVSFPKAL